MKKLMDQKVLNTNGLFDGRYIEAVTLYMHEFGNMPSTLFISQLDGEKAFTHLKEILQPDIKNMQERHWYKRQKRKFQFDRVVMILKENIIIEIDECWCEIYHNRQQDELVEKIVSVLKKYQERKKRQPLEINLIVRNGYQLGLRDM